MKTKKQFSTFVLALFIGTQISYAHTTLKKEDCNFYNLLKTSNIQKTWHWTEDVGYEYINVQICNCDYEIRFGCSCNSDVIGLYGIQDNTMISDEELNSIVENIKQAITKKTIVKTVSVYGETVYSIPCS